MLFWDIFLKYVGKTLEIVIVHMFEVTLLPALFLKETRFFS